MPIELLSLATATPRHTMSQSQALELAERICCTDRRQVRLLRALYGHSGVTNRYTAVPYTDAYRWEQQVSGDVRRDSGTAEVVGESPLLVDAHAPVPINHGPTTEERMAMYREHALPLAIDAAGEALCRASVEPRDVTHIVTASCTGFTAPGIDSGLIPALSLSPTTERVHVGYMGCHGGINALRVAHGLASADPRARVLVCAVELCSLHYTFHWESERMLGNALFADGAAAVIVGQPSQNDTPVRQPFQANKPGYSASPAASQAGKPDVRWQLAATGSLLLPGTANAMTWNVGNHGFAMTISSQLPRLIEANLRPWLVSWLDRQGLALADVAAWAVHPGGPKIVEAVEAAMGLAADQTRFSREVLRDYGNMSSATVFFIVEALRRNGAQPPCVMLGFGPGLVAEAALWR